jgi:hypothetical protein
MTAKRVLRGGSWINDGRNVRSANRNANDPGNRNDNIGFRLAPARRNVDAPFDQIALLSAGLARRQKAHAPRRVSRPDIESPPGRRLAGPTIPFLEVSP